MSSGARFPRLNQLIRSGLGVVVLSASALTASAQQPGHENIPAPRPATSAAATAAAGKITIKQAVDIALERQPAIRAAKADLSGALVQRDAAYALTSNLGGPQIMVRRKQADLGVSLANAGVERATLDTVHAVTRTYVTAVFAGEQVTVAKEAHQRLKVMYETAKRLVEQVGSKEITANDLDRIQTYMLIAETKVNEAQVGIARAKAALREAIGLEWNAPLELAETDLNAYVEVVANYSKEHGAHLSCEKAVRIALGNRADYQQAQLFAEIVCLEIDAQKSTLQPYARTFAATADIHAPILPATVIDGDYRPGPVGPEMPVYLAGSCNARTERAGLLHERALAVVEKAGGLIALQVTEACERLHQEANQVQLLRQASKQATKSRERSEEAYRNDQLKTDVMLTAQVIDSQTKAQLNEALYRHAVALAALQNATSGQIWESFESEAAKMPATK